MMAFTETLHEQALASMEKSCATVLPQAQLLEKLVRDQRQ